MTVTLFIVLLTFIGVWNITDGLFSVCCYPKETFRQHWVRYVRIILGITAVFMAWYFGMAMIR